MSSGESRHLFQISATQVKRGEEMGSGYLNTCKHPDAATAECDVWEFSTKAVMVDIDEPDSLFGVEDCTLWGIEADRLAAKEPGVFIFHMAALYDIWSVTYAPPEEPPEYDMGVKFAGWVDWPKALDYLIASTVK